jgi:hypothetical protein
MDDLFSGEVVHSSRESDRVLPSGVFAARSYLLGVLPGAMEDPPFVGSDQRKNRTIFNNIFNPSR